MKKFFLLLMSSIYLFATNDNLFLVNKYDKEIELEAKIVNKIAQSIFNKGRIKIFIPNITEDEKKFYSELFDIVDECNSEFIFKKREYISTCDKKKVLFTDNYKKLISSKEYIGAFFWSKSRPNIVFIKTRLEENSISLPNTYSQFIEDL